jgi:hypothetical protein
MLAGVCIRTVECEYTQHYTYETFHKEHVQSFEYGRPRPGRDGFEVAEIESSTFVESPSYKAAQTLSRSVTSKRHLSGVHVILGHKNEHDDRDIYVPPAHALETSPGSCMPSMRLSCSAKHHFKLHRA